MITRFREVPIIFSTQTIQAILDGRKSVTRRVIKPQPTGEQPRYCYAGSASKDIGRWHGTDGQWWTPPCHAGDVLWVREMWTTQAEAYYYRADYDSDFIGPCETLSGGYPPECTYHPGCDGCNRSNQPINWHPSIHMPRKAARIFLRATDVHIERLQDITEDQAKAEGACLMGEATSYRGAFAALWDEINAKRDGGRYTWARNPWVWVIEFNRIDKEDSR